MTANKNGVVKLAGILFALGLVYSGLEVTGAAQQPIHHRAAKVIPPQGMDARSTALFLFGEEGWSMEHEARAKRLSQMHTLVVGVDAHELMQANGGSCSNFAKDLAEIARGTQKQNDAFARTPVLVGFGGGAGYAVSAAWAEPNRFKGLVTEAAPDATGMCPVEIRTMTTKAPVRWLDVAEPGTSVVQGYAGATAIEPGGTPRKSFYKSYLRIAGTDSAFDVDTGAGAQLQDLPLTVHIDKNAPHSDVYAIFLSGDGGWANFDEEISDRLAVQGIPVVGISTLRYMWREKSPKQIANDFQRIDQHFSEQFGKAKVMLLGFSLGANTVPFAAGELSEDMRARLAGVGLIAPESHTGFEIVVGGWLGQRTGAIEVAPAIKSLSQNFPANRILCLHGRKERVSACPLADVPGMTRVEFEGGHHMGHDHDGVAQTIADLAIEQG